LVRALPPEGARMMIAMTEVTADGGASRVWPVDVARNTSRQFTFSPDNEKDGKRHARWLGNHEVLLLAKRGERTQLYAASVAAIDVTQGSLNRLEI
jgi:hypothetical protein